MIADQQCQPAPVRVGASAPYQCNAENMLASPLDAAADTASAMLLPLAQQSPSEGTESDATASPPLALWDLRRQSAAQVGVRG